ncbi:DUF2798 domain-containing protein [Microvirga sp. c23x22]|uniref:DUF2798 domain-containing protein n=2 Tax=Microvirga terricola TaxID=2719797 RepID=A0ABX0VDY9_9HYPH|nr:DUF2798 domain-containing protein [Microvirga terricola]NIX77180.1 DUF2798 domain-containing protein [Microvirga terricola]
MRCSPPLRFKKLPAKAQFVVFPLILTLLMSGVVSTIATLKVAGFEPGILLKILQAWGISYAIAFPTALVVMPLVRRIVAALVELPAKGR